MPTVKAAVVGASGYLGEELLRLLQRHPGVTIALVTSRTHAGKPLGEVFPRFAESPLRFCDPEPEAIAGAAEVAFLALPHGLAAEFAVPLLQAGVKVVDISADFRLRDAAAYQAYYGCEHPAPELLADAVYGLPERYREAIRGASLVACPGCYPTSIILPLWPLLAAGLLRQDPGLVACSMSGVSGAGRKLDVPYLFAECNESLRPYAVVGHRHVPEIEQELALAAGAAVAITFTPHLVPVTRGIHSTIVASTARPDVDAQLAVQTLASAYAGEPFVRLLPPGKLADTKHVSRTNCCEIGLAHDRRNGRLILSSAIDNLCKGGAGQAVQCLNLLYALPETSGLV